jgi:ankyrin repeat protein
LSGAIKASNLAAAKLLLENGANPSMFMGSEGVNRYPLIEVSWYISDPLVSRRMVELLLDYGADPHAQGNDNYETILGMFVIYRQSHLNFR